MLTGKKTGGGVLICTKRSLNAYARSEWTRSPSETLWVTIPSNSIRTKADLHIACTYIPGNFTTQVRDISGLISTVDCLLKDNIDNHCLILGDFNLPYITWGKDGPSILNRGCVEIQNCSRSLIDKMNINGFSQFNTLTNSHDIILSTLHLVIFL